jgi:metal-sulfur cluster biosynthetic enzyme
MAGWPLGTSGNSFEKKGPMILDSAKKEIGALKDVYPELEDVKINLVWTPFWNPSMMSEDAREELGYF